MSRLRNPTCTMKMGLPFITDLHSSLKESLYYIDLNISGES